MRTIRELGAFMGVVALLLALAVILGQSAGQAGAAAVVGVIFGVVTAVPVGLGLALLLRRRQGRPVKVVHNHDNRQVIVYLQQPDGSLEQLDEAQARQLVPLAQNGAVR